MRKDIDHLPPSKRRDLEKAVQIIRWKFGEKLAYRTGQASSGRIEKIILYGSMARGDWRADAKTGFKSDYDLLVIVNQFQLIDFEYWAGAEDELYLYESMNPRRHPAEFIVHTLGDVNDQIAKGRPFFTDIKREGIIVYEASPKPLAKRGNLTAEEIEAEARMHYERWYPKIGAFLEHAKIAEQKRAQLDNNLAAFFLHQAVEAAYNCALLTLTLYSPKLHNIQKLREMAGGKDERIFAAWPRKYRRQKQVFELIRRAYVEARYSPHYEITTEQLAFAIECIEQLQTIVKLVWEERGAKAQPARP